MTDTAQPLQPTHTAAPADPTVSTPGVPAITTHPAPAATPAVADTVPSPAPLEAADVSQEDKMALFESLLDEAEQQSAQPADGAVAQPDAPLLQPDAPIAQPAVPVAQSAPAPAPPAAPLETTIVPPGGLSVDPPVDSGVLTQALPMAVHQATDPLLNPANPSGTTAKERTQQTTLEQAGADAQADVGGLQVVEQEPSPEISPEVEAYMQAVQDQSAQSPHEVVIADGTAETAAAAYPSRPVVVVPITQQMEKDARFKSPRFSIAWLVEWSHKIIKIFAGKVLYRSAT